MNMELEGLPFNKKFPHSRGGSGALNLQSAIAGVILNRGLTL